jgi:ankyrin repeat protein
LLPNEKRKYEVLAAFDRNGHQLLHSAVAGNQPTLVVSLLNQGASPDITSAPSTLTWRYDANFKTEDYIPPQLTAREMAAKAKLGVITDLFEQRSVASEVLASEIHNR